MAIFYALRCSHSWNLEELRKTADAKTETPKERIKRFFPQIFFFSPPRKRDFESETYGVSKSLIFIAPFSRLNRRKINEKRVATMKSMDGLALVPEPCPGVRLSESINESTIRHLRHFMERYAVLVP